MFKGLCVLVFILLWILPKNVLAQEFSSAYDVSYDVSIEGITQVTEKITLINLTENYFASGFTLAIVADDISNLEAFDSLGPLTTSVAKVGPKSQIRVSFGSQVIGKNKEYSWTLKFNSKDFAQKQGQVWQVSVPRISSQSNVSEFNLSLFVPVEFGDPTIIVPQPVNTGEEFGRIKLDFNKEQMLQSGILASFGSEQFFDFRLLYKLKNNSILPATAKISLPANGDFQQVAIDKINPQPFNVTIDEDGNYLAWFKLGRRESRDILVEGKARLTKDRLQKTVSIPSKLTSNQKYWESDNPQVKTKLSQVLAGSTSAENQLKANLISKFVANTLVYDFDRLKNKDFQRLGAITSLVNPQKALCLEFSDLFITLSRAAGIPSRLSIGYAYSGNQHLRPTLEGGLHCWAQYFDPSEDGWVIVDPTWEATTGGVDYFSKFDLNHLALANRGISSEKPKAPDQIIVNFSDNFEGKSELNLEILSPETIFALFPAKAKIIVKNQGNFESEGAELFFSSGKLTVLGIKSFTLPKIPPKGVFEHEFELRTDSLWSSFEDILQLRVDDQSVDRKITVKPFFAYKYFSLGVLGATLAMVLIYIFLVALYFRKVRSPNKKI